MKTGEKIRKVRTEAGMTQIELAQKAGITSRSIGSYENGVSLPHLANLKKIAVVLGVSVAYLSDEQENDPLKDIDKDAFYNDLTDEFGSKAVSEASRIVDQTTALFAGGELPEEAKDSFMKAIMDIYTTSKRIAKAKYTSGKNKT